LNGSAITQDKDETRTLYGDFVPFSDLLTGKVPPPNSSEPFLAAVQKYAQQSKDKERGELTNPMNGKPPAGH